MFASWIFARICLEAFRSPQLVLHSPTLALPLVLYVHCPFAASPTHMRGFPSHWGLCTKLARRMGLLPQPGRGRRWFSCTDVHHGSELWLNSVLKNPASFLRTLTLHVFPFQHKQRGWVFSVLLPHDSPPHILSPYKLLCL